jgi:hypothetical protein
MNQCDKCDKCFARKSNLQCHVDNNSCKMVVKIKCPYCIKMYTSKQSMDRHVRSNCNGKKEIDEKNSDRQKTFDELVKNQLKLQNDVEVLKNQLKLQNDVEVLKKENTKLKETIKSGNTIMVAGEINTGNVTKNTINNFLIGYGKEDLSKINRDEMVDGVKDGFYSTVSLLDTIHFNPEYPEYHNVYISSMKNKYAMMYDGTNWTLVMKADLINKLYMDKRNYIEENLDDFLDSLTNSQKNALDRWMNTDEDHKKIKEIKNKIKLLLYNKRNIVLNSLNSTSDPQLILIEENEPKPGTKRKGIARVVKNKST